MFFLGLTPAGERKQLAQPFRDRFAIEQTLLGCLDWVTVYVMSSKICLWWFYKDTIHNYFWGKESFFLCGEGNRVRKKCASFTINCQIGLFVLALWILYVLDPFGWGGWKKRTPQNMISLFDEGDFKNEELWNSDITYTGATWMCSLA